MWRILEANLELAVESGFIYAPLLFDPDIAREMREESGVVEMRDADGPRRVRSVIEFEGKPFTVALSLESLLENFDKLHPESFEQLKTTLLEKYGHSASFGSLSVDAKLRVILFEVLPYFVRKRKGLKRETPGEEEILDLIGDRLEVPEKFFERADRYLDIGPLKETAARLRRACFRVGLPRDGTYEARELRGWFLRALETRVLAEEAARLEVAAREREGLKKASKSYIALLLYIADLGFLELDGFGFSRFRFHGEYMVYKRTGEYALMAYDGRLYLFADCRVAVPTFGPLRPVVLEKYKHPFLFAHDRCQQICMRDWDQPARFSAPAAISTIEEGVNSLLYGYNYRRRNGYHSLDRITQHFRSVDFDDLRIPDDHPKIASGEVRVTNR